MTGAAPEGSSTSGEKQTAPDPSERGWGGKNGKGGTLTSDATDQQDPSPPDGRRRRCVHDLDGDATRFEVVADLRRCHRQVGHRSNRALRRLTAAAPPPTSHDQRRPSGMVGWRLAVVAFAGAAAHVVNCAQAFTPPTGGASFAARHPAAATMGGARWRGAAARGRAPRTTTPSMGLLDYVNPVSSTRSTWWCWWSGALHDGVVHDRWSGQGMSISISASISIFIIRGRGTIRQVAVVEVAWQPPPPSPPPPTTTASLHPSPRTTHPPDQPPT